MNTVSKKNKILLAFACLIFIVNCVVLLFGYDSIPHNIVVHSYNGGNDGYGSKSHLWVLVALNAILLLVISIAILNLHKWMRPTPEMPPNERAESIENARLILAIVAIKISIVFSIILFKQSAVVYV